MSEEQHTIVTREPYESCTVDLSENTKGELRISVKMLKGGPSIDEGEAVERAWNAYIDARNRIMEDKLSGR